MGKVITFGEIMLRLAPEGYYRFVQAQTLGATYGGGEANVATPQPAESERIVGASRGLCSRGSAHRPAIRAEEGVGVFPAALGGVHRQISLMHQVVVITNARR